MSRGNQGEAHFSRLLAGAYCACLWLTTMIPCTWLISKMMSKKVKQPVHKQLAHAILAIRCLLPGHRLQEKSHLPRPCSMASVHNLSEILLFACDYFAYL